MRGCILICSATKFCADMIIAEPRYSGAMPYVHVCVRMFNAESCVVKRRAFCSYLILYRGAQVLFPPVVQIK